ncbi:hypothetical protein [Actinoplanes teichomyceticus]|uniref:FAD binding domain-containing protein n=1 Tax=Actinoplanes teichomyceticus TaxID=1867 RepID=A0A561VMH2_ACTTI|nr:hypothetical protein [Actinoplanes teichomyceticus]TWG12819.1 hypothetical protein FHX34_105687 [Actinoplanes teichomyceticus]GIF13564.1 hypothetical protein Ate01nite_35960 [Actinoplanes teichomyceticus]
MSREGFEPTVLERSPGRRDAGQNVDIRGLGRVVLERMGILDAVWAKRTGETGTRFVDRDGRVRAELRPEPGRDASTAELEILRGRLSEILLAAIEDDVQIRYGDFVTAAHRDASGVDIETERGRRERFDMLVVAEGRSSRTRRLLFAGETRRLDKGVTIAYGTIDRRDSDSDWWQWMTTTGGRTAGLRPDNVGTIRAHLSFQSLGPGPRLMHPQTSAGVSLIQAGMRLAGSWPDAAQTHDMSVQL